MQTNQSMRKNDTATTTATMDNSLICVKNERFFKKLQNFWSFWIQKDNLEYKFQD